MVDHCVSFYALLFPPVVLDIEVYGTLNDDQCPVGETKDICSIFENRTVSSGTRAGHRIEFEENSQFCDLRDYVNNSTSWLVSKKEEKSDNYKTSGSSFDLSPSEHCGSGDKKNLNSELEKLLSKGSCSDDTPSEWKQIIQEHESNVWLRWSTLGMGVLTSTYYVASLSINPVGTGALLSFELLRYLNDDVDKFCKENKSFFGYSICSAIEVALTGYSAYTLSGAVGALNLSGATKFGVTIAMTATGKGMSRSLIKDDSMMPSPSRYGQNLAYEVTSDAIEIVLDLAFPAVGWVAKKSFSAVSGYAVKELVKNGNEFEVSEVGIDSLKNVACKFVFSISKVDDLVRYQVDGYCKDLVEWTARKVIAESSESLSMQK